MARAGSPQVGGTGFGWLTMVFSSVVFLFYFLPLVVALYLVAPARLRNPVLLLSSLVFYVWGGGAQVVILFVSTIVDYIAGRLVDHGIRSNRSTARRFGLVLSLSVNIGLLAYFKYANFVVAEMNTLGDALGVGTIAWTSVTLPIGISFFTFQSMSYTIDIHRGKVRHLDNPLDFALYVTLFPQLIAGPIVRFHELADEIRQRSLTSGDLAAGLVRFGHGLAKKVIIADSVAPLADAAFADTSDLSTGAAWLGALAYTVQIYFDFSGYSDMAIGLGRMFGFHFPENFARPYSSASITEFWRRWHISLSNWFRDYVYIPLGGSRRGPLRTSLNLAIVFLTTGIWHGANWTFILWGIYHGALLAGERVLGLRGLDQERTPWLRRLVTLVLVVFGWVLFRASSVGSALEVMEAMVTPTSGVLPGPMLDAWTTKSTIALLAGLLTAVLPPMVVAGPYLSDGAGRRADIARLVLVVGALPYALVLVLAGTFSPFLYFQF
ncbi:MAG: MBOAT family O-acyltransferase [Acidimicrobiales bacterium]